MNRKSYQIYLRWGERCNDAAEDQYKKELETKRINDRLSENKGIWTYLDCPYSQISFEGSYHICDMNNGEFRYYACEAICHNKLCPKGYVL